ncbi:3'-5' exonuclease [Blattabacterium cuenoti]|uniref:3'-5' exonuclease n=1 Tax=Blattabacterium cuenoti TaxID=1653831 RepID=UPI00163BF1D1|nr:3'-5' exonuclease [Blattabacterium cuenoti]
MKLKLYRPICFFDIESTGINIGKDRIIEISILKIYPNNNKESNTWLVYPEIPIPPQSTAIHGIKNEDVIGKKTFKDISSYIFKMIENTDLAGYNSNRFDIPILAEEMLRAGIPFNIKKYKTIDVQVIFHKMEPRTLSAAYKYYCKKNLTKAHTSKADVFATYEILLSQLDKYKNLKKDVKNLDQFSHQKNIADLAGFIKINENRDEIFNFGKYKGKKVFEVLKKDPNYYIWIQNSDFPLYTKKILTEIKLRNFNKK